MASRSFVTMPALVVRMSLTERSFRPFSIPNCFATAIVWMLLLQTTVVAAWSTSRRAVIQKACSADNSQMTSLKFFGFRSNSHSIFQPTRLQSSSTTAEMEEDRLVKKTKNPQAFLGVNAYSGLSEKEFSVLIATVEDAYAELVGLTGVSCETATASVDNDSGENLPVGALHRVLSLTTNLDEESAECLRALVAERMDHLIYGTGELQQPVLVSVGDSKNSGSIEAIIRGEIEQYGLRSPICSAKKNGKHQESVDEEADRYIPSFRIDIDGAETSIGDSGETFWDASSVVVFDNLVSDDLRRRLLDVVKGKSSDTNEWNDIENGPDPNRWLRGGLQDIPHEGEEGKDDENEETLSCWGLPTEAIEELCFQQHEAIDEFESILTNLFPQFVVSRLPEAVYGECVSPLTANAPVAGEEELYDYHIDGDPLQTPPSPWTDVYGRYPNRSKGKPRFVSCILYLNDDWEASEWGAPTKFYDPPTQSSYEVLPEPGRCVFLDQDLGHTVTPPKPAAGKRPRYSLVWKLVLHPKRENQDMTDLSHADSSWPEPILFGSAANRP